MALNGPKIGPFLWPNTLAMKSSKSIPKFSWKSVKNQPILGLKKPSGLSVLEDRSSGGLGPPKMPSVRAVLGLRPWPDPSLTLRLSYPFKLLCNSTFQTYDKLKTIPLLEEAVPKNLCQTSPFSALGSWENGFSPLDLIFI